MAAVAPFQVLEGEQATSAMLCCLREALKAKDLADAAALAANEQVTALQEEVQAKRAACISAEDRAASLTKQVGV